MTPSKLLLAKLRKYLKLALHTNRLSSLLPTYFYYSTPLSKMLLNVILSKTSGKYLPLGTGI